MELFRTFRERRNIRRQTEIQQQAEDLITLQDFNNSLFIAYHGTPLAPIDVSWTTKEIVQQLSVFRNNFIQSRMKESGMEEEYND
jgi:hypothetical protein